MDLTAPELRVLGCLIEKQRTTPDTYPLTLNALRMACNQSTARDPVVRYDDAIVRDAMTRLSRRRWARLAGGGRAPKFRHLLDEALTRAPDELAVLCVLMLRGPQTPGELKQRAERLHPFADLAAIHETLRRLIERDLVMQLARRPGQKEERYAHLLGGDDGMQAAPPAPTSSAPPSWTPHATSYGAIAVPSQRAPATDQQRPQPVPAAAQQPPAAPDPQVIAAGDVELLERFDQLEADVAELRAATRVERLEGEVAKLRAELRALLDELS